MHKAHKHGKYTLRHLLQIRLKKNSWLWRRDLLCLPRATHPTLRRQPSAMRQVVLKWPPVFTGPKPSPQPTCPCPSPLHPQVRSAPSSWALPLPPSPVLPDGVGDPPHADTVGRLCQSLHLTLLPIAAAPLHGGGLSARHLPVPGPCAAALTLPPCLRRVGAAPRSFWAGATRCPQPSPPGENA